MPAGLPGGGRGPAPASAPRPGRTAIAWVAILLIVGVVAFIQAFAPRDGDGGTGFAVRMMETQVRLHYGLSTVLQGLPGGASSSGDFEVLKATIGRGPAPIRQRLAVVAGDLRGCRTQVREPLPLRQLRVLLLQLASQSAHLFTHRDIRLLESHGRLLPRVEQRIQLGGRRLHAA